MALRGLAGSVPSDSAFAGYHKAPGSEREYAQVKSANILKPHLRRFQRCLSQTCGIFNVLRCSIIGPAVAQWVRCWTYAANLGSVHFGLSLH